MAHAFAAEPKHHVRFYEDANVLGAQVGSFFETGLRSGGAAVAVARPLTLSAIELELTTRGLDVAELRARKRLVMIDADDMLAKLLVSDQPDRARFQEHVGGLARSLIDAGYTVHAYGEMVDILWQGGNRSGVIALESQWTELLAELPITLVCGYQLRAFDRDIEGFELVCNHHDAVEPCREPPQPTLTASRMLAQLEQRARALEVEVERRTHLERRMAALLDLTGQLAGAADIDQIARLTVSKGAQAVGAIDGALWIVAPGATHLELVTSSRNLHTDADAERYSVIAIASDTPVAHAMRMGEALFIGSLDQYAEQFPASRERIEDVRKDGQRAFAILPVAIDERSLGCVVFTFDHEREFAAPDRAFKTILARQCALALARVEQQEQERALREAAERAAAAEKEARNEVELLYDLIAAVNQLDEPAAVYDLALETVRRGARSERAAILLFDSDGVMRFKASQGLSAAYQQAVEGHTPWQRDTVGAVPIAVHDVEADPAWESYRDVFRAEGIRALAFVPVIHHRQLIGKFMLYRNEPRKFDTRDLQFSATVAVHVAQAVERKRNESELARAYREERQAHLEAEEATRAREEILSVVSHDLRNPLGTILMGATALLSVDVGERSHRVRSVAERIHRQAERMARLIEDLVDFAGIQAGQLAIQRKAHKAEEILSATSDIFNSIAQERGLRFETRALPNLPSIDCDCERAVQVMSNLVANALKVTPKGGAISIGAEPMDDAVVFFVRDTGPGIEAEELPQLFERYWRSKHSQYKGAGLGLSIARGIVDAHGGRIWAESQLGRGSTFYFSLASVRNN